MSVILAGPQGKIVMAAPGRPMLLGPLSTENAPMPTPTPSPVITDLRAIAGLSGWWDAGVPAGMLDATGTPLLSFGREVGAVANKCGSGASLSVWHAGGPGPSPVATPRLNRMLGGVGLSTVIPPLLPAAGQQLPVLHPDQGLITGGLPVGAGMAWTVMLVWSRPNWRQSSNGASTLLSITGTPVLTMDNSAGPNQLVLFPGSRGTVLSSTLSRRHTHAVLLRNTPGAGVDAWLDGTQVASGVSNAMPSALTAPLLFLHSGAANGGAECWFHEAAFWQSSLSTADTEGVLSYQRRWALGPRRGIQVLVTGQSNAGNGLNDGAWHLLAQGVAWHLGALAFGVVGSYGSPPAATCIHGEGLYPVPALGLTGSFLNDPGNGSDPSSWVLGSDGLAVQGWIQSSTAAVDASDIAVILWAWSEDDSTRQYGEKATYKAAATRFLSLERGMLSRSAASLPQVWWSAIPFAYGNNDPGMQMQREVVAEMAADPAQNVTVVLPQTADSLPRGVGGPALTYDPAAGTWSGGDALHRDIADNQRFGRLAAPLAARAVLASAGGDTLNAIPAGVPSRGGPAVTHVYRQSGTTLVITIQHDGGADLIVPATQAATGIGWAVMDGGSAGSPGRIVSATACTRLSPTQLQITLAQPLVNPSAACRLFYPYGAATIGRGNAVTDDLSTVAPPAGWDIAADLGSAWRLDMPVHVPMASPSGVVLSDTP
jgi:hypothetical protein